MVLVCLSLVLRLPVHGPAGGCGKVGCEIMNKGAELISVLFTSGSFFELIQRLDERSFRN
jgi:hypothetical protein